MRANRRAKLLRPNRLYRGIALFFLLFTLLDLTCPGFCDDERGDLFAAQAAAPTLTAATHADADAPTESESGCPVEEDDCFCCCAHLLPAGPLETPAVTSRPAKYLTAVIHLPNAPPGATDHPPRSH